MSMFNEKKDVHEIIVSTRGDLVKLRAINNKKVNDILMTKEKSVEVGQALISISKKIK